MVPHNIFDKYHSWIFILINNNGFDFLRSSFLGPILNFFLYDMIYNLYPFCMLLINLMNFIYFEYRVDQKNGEGKDWDKKNWEYNK